MPRNLKQAKINTEAVDDIRSLGFGQAEEEAAVAGYEIELEFSPADSAPAGHEASEYTREILYAGMIAEGNQYDKASSDLFILRVSGAGKSCTVHSPQRLDDRTLAVMVTRDNETDFVTWLSSAGATDGDRNQAKVDLDSALRASFGDHITYEIVTTAYSTLVSATDSWTITVTIFDPYTFADLSQVLVLQSGSMRHEALIIAQLLKERPTAAQEAKVFLIGGGKDEQ